MAKHLEIILKPFDPKHNDYNCPPGELRPGNYTTLPDGSIGPGIEARTTLPDIGRAVCVHQSRLIVWRDGSLGYLPLNSAVTPTASPVIMAPASQPPLCHASHGDTLTLCHDGALHFYTWRGRGYDHSSQLPPLPAIDFGLVAAGTLTASPRVVVDASAISAAESRDGGATHPSANHSGETISPGANSSSSAGGTALSSCFSDALDAEAHSRGLFAMPFLLRYALRDHRGSYLAVSPPQLMLPTVLPPRLAVTDTAVDGNSASMRIDLSANRLFRLCCRAADPAVPMPQEWIDEIEAIDIFVSPEFPTFDASSRRGFFTAYGDMVRRADNGAPNRGRECSSDDAPVFDGHFSLDGVSFTDHHIGSADMHANVWWVEPNSHLCADIASASDFYRVASLDPTDLPAEFSPIAVDNSSAEALRRGLRLDPDMCHILMPVPAALYCLDGRLFAAGGMVQPEPPADYRIMQPFAGNVAEEPSQLVSVRIFCHDGNEITATESAASVRLSPGQCFPRYVYHPDSSAFMMQIRCDDLVYELPLRPHDGLGGVYWFGGLDATHAPSPVSSPAVLQSSLLLGRPRQCPHSLHVSATGSLRAFTRTACVDVGQGEIVAICAALKAPGNALPGRFPLYVFSSDGIRMLEFSAGSVVSTAMVSADSCSSSATIAACPDGVAYSVDGCVKWLKGGSSSVIVCRDWLPEGLCNHFSGQEAQAHAALAWIPGLGGSGALAVSSRLIFFPDSGTFATVGIDFRYAISSEGLLQLDDSSVGILAHGNASGIITRPIRLVDALRGVTVLGAPRCSSGISVFGSNHPHPSLWVPIGTSRSHRLDILAKNRWKYIIVAIS